jgi:putative membrane protein
MTQSGSDLAAPESASARRVIAGLSAFVVCAVAAVLFAAPRRVASPASGPDVLATVNAALNAGATACLVSGFAAIKAKRIALHRACMLVAFVLSSVFLVTYLLHHASVGSVAFRGEGVLRAVYFAVLVPHVLLAAIIVPLALATLYRGWTRNVARHRKIARFTLPLWLYVSVSGVVLYLMLYR